MLLVPKRDLRLLAKHPVGNVDVMRAKFFQQASARFAVETPVHQVFQAGIGHLAAPVVAAMPVAVDVRGLANISLVDAIDRIHNPGGVAHLMAYLVNLAGLSHRVDDIPTIVRSKANRLFAIHWTSAFHGRDGVGGVKDRRSRDEDDVQIFAVEQLTIILMSGNILADQFIHFSEARLIHITLRGNIDAWRAQ